LNFGQRQRQRIIHSGIEPIFLAQGKTCKGSCAWLGFGVKIRAVVIRQFIVRYLQKLPKQLRETFKACLYGLAAGLGAVAFQKVISIFYEAGLVRFSHASFSEFALVSFIILVVSSLIVGLMLNLFCPEAAGSGIPQVKLSFWKDFGAMPWRIAWVKFIAGVVSIAGGASMGREGPSVQLAAAVSSNLAGVVGEPKQNRRTASAAGAAAGLAAAFNAPLAALTFVLEEIIGDLNSRLLGSVLLAAVIGAMVVQGLIGKQPAFTLTGVDTPSWLGYAMTPVVAVLASVVGVYFQRFSLGLRQKSRRTKVPRWLLPVMGGLITWVLGLMVFHSTGKLGVFGLGYEDLSGALDEKILWKTALILLAAKFVATFCCYGFGGCGGIFSPCLFFGGMVGVIVAGVINIEWPVMRPDVIAMAVVGMSATLGAVVGAPVTGILIVFEMTHEFSLVPALMLGALVSQAISRKMNPENFYDELLTQDGHRIEHMRPPRDLWSWQQSPVAMILTGKPVVLTDVNAATLEETLGSHPYNRFPVLIAGKLEGILTRAEAEAALAGHRPPRIEPPTTCLPEQTIRELQTLLIASSTNFVVVIDHTNQVMGVLTLHDLLRAEVEKAAA
jgi:CIC family chloride channel protein